MDGVIFDFNGTMFFDDAFQTQSWEQFILQKTGRTITPEEFVDYAHGRNMKETLQYFLGRDVKREEAAQLEEEKEVLYRALCLGSPAFRLADGLPEFLDLLAERNIPCTIATASGWNNVSQQSRGNRPDSCQYNSAECGADERRCPQRCAAQPEPLCLFL